MEFLAYIYSKNLLKIWHDTTYHQTNYVPTDELRTSTRSCALAIVVYLKLDTILLSNKSERPEGRAKREPLLFIII